MNLAFSRLAALITATVVSAVSAGAATADPGTIVVPHGQPVQIAFVNDLTGVVSAFAPSLSNAVRMAVGLHPTVRGFRIQINSYDNGCGDPVLLTRGTFQFL